MKLRSNAQAPATHGSRNLRGTWEKLEFSVVRQSGSHMIYKNPQGKRVTVPFHAAKILHPKVLKSILRGAGITAEALTNLL